MIAEESEDVYLLTGIIKCLEKFSVWIQISEKMRKLSNRGEILTKIDLNIEKIRGLIGQT